MSVSPTDDQVQQEHSPVDVTSDQNAKASIDDTVSISQPLVEEQFVSEPAETDQTSQEVA